MVEQNYRETVGPPALRDARSIETLLDADLISESGIGQEVFPTGRERNCTAAGMC